MIPPSFRYRARRWPPGYTVVELLISIGLLAILLVLVFNGSQAIRQKSKQTRCIANLRQIGVIFGLYLGDHAMTFPPTSDENQILVGGQKGSYSGYNSKPETRPLNRYLNGDYRVFKCPADVGYRNNPKREQMQPEFKGKTYYDVLGSSYRYNARNLFGRGSLTRVKKPVNAEMHKLSDIRTPSSFIVMGDSDTFSWSTAPIPWWTHWHGVANTDDGTATYPGCPVANVLFADWHVETIVVSSKPSPHNFGNNYHFDVENKP